MLSNHHRTQCQLLSAENHHQTIPEERRLPPLDLSSLRTVRAFAESWLSKNYSPIVCLILNAGAQFLGPMETNEEGYERTFMINHLGHALLFHLFAPYLTPDARIIVTASGTHNPIQTQKSGLPDPAFTTAEELAPEPKHCTPQGNAAL